jgi:glycosyltransferase involved in cell wall biosynthesis
MRVGSISVIVITHNEEGNIRECLESVQWADEIVVVDSHSTDKTVAIARTFTRKIFQHSWDGFGKTKNFALSKAKGEWILSLDADERVTPELAHEIQQVVKDNNSAYSAFSIPRKAFFLGRWIKHCGWYPGRVVRLFRRTAGHFSETQVHESLRVSGTIGQLRNDILHFTDPNLHHYFEKYNRYTSLAAKDMAARGEQFRLGWLLVRPVWTFLRMYVFRAGFLDGMEGFILCRLSASYVFTKYAKLWELQHRGQRR